MKCYHMKGGEHIYFRERKTEFMCGPIIVKNVSF